MCGKVYGVYGKGRLWPYQNHAFRWISIAENRHCFRNLVKDSHKTWGRVYGVFWNFHLYLYENQAFLFIDVSEINCENYCHVELVYLNFILCVYNLSLCSVTVIPCINTLIYIYNTKCFDHIWPSSLIRLHI